MKKYLILLLMLAMASCETKNDDDNGGNSGGVSDGEYFTKLIYTGAKQFVGLGAAEDKQELMDESSSVKVDGNVGARAFRIPAILTIPGYTFVTADMRYGAPADSAHNIDSVIRRSTDNGKNWEPMRIIQEFDDFAPTNLQEPVGGNYSSAGESASFIDPAIVYTKNGDLLTLTTTFPWNSGLMDANKGRGVQPLPSYFKMGNAIYLKLRPGTVGAGGGNDWRGDDNKDGSYTHAVKVSDFKDGKNPIVLKNGDPVTGAQAGYTVDKFYNLYYKGKAVTTTQYAKGHPWRYQLYPAIPKTKVSPEKNINVNLFYTDSSFHPVPTSYIFLAKSTDKGNTWSEPYDITWQFDNKPSETLEPAKNKLDLSPTSFLGVSPGTGYVIKEGTYAGRVLIALQQSPGNDGCTAFSIYSDNNGETWNSGERVSTTTTGGRRSESQYIEAPDNQLLLVHRNNTYLTYSTSKNGGVTWDKITEPVDQAGNKIVNVAAGGKQNDSAMVGAANLRQTHYFNKPMFAISIATGVGRTAGKVYVGYLEKKDGYWDMNFDINGNTIALPWNPNSPNETAAYSSVAELGDGSLGLFYEGAGYGGGGTIGSTISFARFPVTTE